MSARKLQKLFTQTSKDSKRSENIEDKASIEALKKSLQNKLKDPNLARKAAMIISELLQKKVKKD